MSTSKYLKPQPQVRLGMIDIKQNYKKKYKIIHPAECITAKLRTCNI